MPNFNFNIRELPKTCAELVGYPQIFKTPTGAIANAVGVTPPVTPPDTTTPINSQTAQPVAAKSGNYLIVSSIPPGDYTVTNAANPSQKKTYTVTSKACLISDRTQIGSPSAFLISRQGLTFPIVWNALQQVSTVPSCN